MPLAVVYPATLPSPSAAQVVEVERRFLAQSPFDARAFQLDRAAQQDVTFPLMTEQQAAQFDDWWRNTLNRGGAWFAARWPLPRGLVSASRQFIGRPQYTFVAGGYWQITAQFWVRGAGLPPVLWGETVLGMRMQGNVDNEAGPSIVAYPTTSHNTPPTFPAGAAKFGALGYRSSGYSTQPLISGNLGNFSLARFGEWAIKIWLKPGFQAGFGVGGYVMQLLAGRLAGNNFGSSGEPAGQITMFVTGVPGDNTKAQLGFYYPSTSPVDGTVVESPLVQLTPAAPVYLPVDGQHHFVYICGGDAQGNRAYLDTQLWMVDYDTTTGLGPTNYPGRFPMLVRDYDNQRFVIGSADVGTYSDHPDTAIWPDEFAFASGFIGDIGELWVSQGLGCIEYTGTTITPPAVPAILRV